MCPLSLLKRKKKKSYFDTRFAILPCKNVFAAIYLAIVVRLTVKGCSLGYMWFYGICITKRYNGPLTLLLDCKYCFPKKRS